MCACLITVLINYAHFPIKFLVREAKRLMEGSWNKRHVLQGKRDKEDHGSAVQKASTILCIVCESDKAQKEMAECFDLWIQTSVGSLVRRFMCSRHAVEARRRGQT